MFTAARNPPAKPSAVLENAGGFGRCRPAQIRRIGLSHGVWIVLKPAAVHQLFNPLDIKPPIGDVLPQPLTEFSIPQQKLGPRQIACSAEMGLSIP
jgi:hypothetical protein